MENNNKDFMINELINIELIKANRKFPLFQSRHEAYGVILEELEELESEIKDIRIGILVDYWQKYCKNSKANLPNINNLLDCLSSGIKCAINELIQLGAMIEKAKMLENKFNEYAELTKEQLDKIKLVTINGFIKKSTVEYFTFPDPFITGNEIVYKHPLNDFYDIFRIKKFVLYDEILIIEFSEHRRIKGDKVK